MTWIDPGLNTEVKAQFGGRCVAQAIVAALRRRGEVAAEKAAKAEALEAGFSGRDLRQLERDGFGPVYSRRDDD
jgi:hypothetical protein